MGVHESAAAALAALWDDGGEAVLEAAELGGDWPTLLAPLPAQIFVIRPDEGDPGEVILGRLREVFAQAGRELVALVFAEALWQRRAQVLGSGHVDTLVARGRFGAMLDRFGHVDEAHAPLEGAWRGLRDALPRPDLRAAIAAGDLARNARRREDLPQAASLLAQALRIRRVVAPRRTALVSAQLAEVHLALGEQETAARLLHEAWEQLCETRGPQETVTLDRARTLGPLLMRLDDHARALPVLESLWEWVATHGDGGGEERAQVAYDLGRAYDFAGRRELGLRRVEEAVRWTRQWSETQGEPHPELAQRLATWARMAEQRGRRDEAEGHLLEAVEAERRLHGPDSPDVGIRQAAVGDLLYRSGRLDEAIGWMDAGIGLLRSAVGDDHELTRVVTERLIDLLLERADQVRDVQRDKELAWEYIYQARAICLDVLGPEHPSHKTLKYWGERR